MFAKKRSGLATPRAGRRLNVLLKGLVGALALVLFAGALTPPAQAQTPGRGRVGLKGGRPPRPPRPPSWVQAQQLINPGVRASLNPQPLPPRLQQSVGRVNPGVLSSLNPQPLPPRVFTPGLNAFAGR